MVADAGGGGGWGDGPTKFDEFSHEALKKMIDGARPAELTASGKALLDAKETLETLTTALETRISRLEWKGKSADSFRDWAGKVMVATRKFAEHSGTVGTAMDHAGSELSFALLTMPEVPANAKVIVDSNGDKKLLCQPGDSPDKKVLVESAKTELEKARQEAIRRMESLGSTYTVTTETLAKAPAVEFPPLPALPQVTHHGGGGTTGDPRRTGDNSTVRTTTGRDGGTLIPGHGPNGDGGVVYSGSDGSGSGGSGSGGVGGPGGYVPPVGTDLQGTGPFQNGPTPVLDGPPGPTGPGLPGPGGSGPFQQNPPGGLPGGFPPPAGGKVGIPPGGKTGVTKAQLTSNPLPGNGRNPNVQSSTEPVTGGRPFGRGPGGGGGGEHPSGGRFGGKPGGAGGRRFTGQSGGVVGGTPRTASGAGRFSSGGSGLAGRAGAGAGGQAGAGRGGMRGGGGMGAGGGERDQRNRRQRADYLREEEETWVGDRTTAPPVVD
ncbi:WXG100 family type VII secretion target [Embleya sp. MST-111070]|uniref:WXG100 family type VII secretion target n=1 Tax=Embleya sp. MST-111070 TaxID=3398231 RepID=UPI003F73EF28